MRFMLAIYSSSWVQHEHLTWWYWSYTVPVCLSIYNLPLSLWNSQLSNCIYVRVFKMDFSRTLLLQLFFICPRHSLLVGGRHRKMLNASLFNILNNDWFLLLFVTILITSKILLSYYKPNLQGGPNNVKSGHSCLSQIDFLAYFMTYGGFILYMHGAFYSRFFRGFMGLVTLIMSSVDARALYYKLMRCRPVTSTNNESNCTPIKH